MATATVIESFFIDFFNLTEAKPKTTICDICKKVLEKKLEKHLQSKSRLFKTGEKKLNLGVQTSTKILANCT